MNKQTINPNYTLKFKDFILNIQEYFSKNNNSIHKARNEIKILTHSNQEIVVKSFNVPHLLNRIVYTFFRDSKAKKSYDYSVKISNFVPTPIGYIEFHESRLISESYFISENFHYDFTIREPLSDANFTNKETIFKAFAYFTFQLHKQNIYHLDYSPGNILIKEKNGQYIFKIVDINRMEFKPLDLETRLKNFAKLWAKDEDLEMIIREYAMLINKDEKSCVEIALKYSKQHKKRKNFKKILKGKKIVD